MKHLRAFCIASLALAALMSSPAAFAADDVILIDQNKALADVSPLRLPHGDKAGILHLAQC